jgi:hypothetical protein
VNLFLFVLQRERFVDEHDGDVILNAVDQLAVVAHQLILRFPVFQGSRATWVPYALGAGQNFQKVFTQGHGFFLSIFGETQIITERMDLQSLCKPSSSKTLSRFLIICEGPRPE